MRPYKRDFNSAKASREDWLRERKTGIGGSDAGAILGMNPWRSRIDVWLDKTGDKIEEGTSEAMRQGTDLEEYVARRFTEATGIAVQRNNFMMRSIDHPFMVADIDRQVVGENAILECKTTSAWNRKQWEHDDIPPSYLVQVLHYMAVTGAEKAYIACVVLGQDFVWREIPRDEEAISALVKAEEAFWETYVMPKKMPEPDGSDAADAAIKSLFPEAKEESVVDIPADDIDMDRYDDVCSLISTLEKEKKQTEQKLKLAMGEAETGILPGLRKVTWKERAGRKTVDSKKLEKLYPDAYEDCLKEGKPYRVLKIYDKPELEKEEA